MKDLLGIGFVNGLYVSALAIPLLDKVTIFALLLGWIPMLALLVKRLEETFGQEYGKEKGHS